ncbi:hypothetical protein B0I35DRAFT_215922 [Stachybotrys elegans]|uniref:Uncharacterized protein n=1 Tax=Stachybotrys elegans TaxID=80388 RepID=A0A8K0STF4_9HYPO|nr:hypothetical protein B0I35DRAFT_215922 [Stachybotrys elegans]
MSVRSQTSCPCMCSRIESVSRKAEAAQSQPSTAGGCARAQGPLSGHALFARGWRGREPEEHHHPGSSRSREGAPLLLSCSLPLCRWWVCTLHVLQACMAPRTGRVYGRGWRGRESWMPRDHRMMSTPEWREREERCCQTSPIATHFEHTRTRLDKWWAQPQGSAARRLGAEGQWRRASTQCNTPQRCCVGDDNFPCRPRPIAHCPSVLCPASISLAYLAFCVWCGAVQVTCHPTVVSRPAMPDRSLPLAFRGQLDSGWAVHGYHEENNKK